MPASPATQSTPARPPAAARHASCAACHSAVRPTRAEVTPSSRPARRAGRPVRSSPAPARPRAHVPSRAASRRRTAAPRPARPAGSVPASTAGRPARGGGRSVAGAGRARRPRYHGPRRRPSPRGSRAPRRPGAAAARAPRRPSRRHSPAADPLRSCPSLPPDRPGRVRQGTRRRRPTPPVRRSTGPDPQRRRRRRRSGQRAAQVVDQLAQVGPCLGGSRVRPQLAGQLVPGHPRSSGKGQPRHQPRHPLSRENGIDLPVHRGPDLPEQPDHDVHALGTAWRTRRPSW